MELLRISETKMKVMLDRADMERYRMNASELDYKKSETRNAFWGILDEVKKRSGFDVSCGKTLIQCYPSKDGGCELFVTKLGSFPEVTERSVNHTGNAAMLSGVRTAYLFREFSELLSAARAVADADTIRKSDVYAAENGGYYLVVEERDLGAGRLCRSARISEFGRVFFPKSEGAAMLYINEHAVRLSEGDAIARLAAL